MNNKNPARLAAERVHGANQYMRRKYEQNKPLTEDTAVILANGEAGVIRRSTSTGYIVSPISNPEKEMEVKPSELKPATPEDIGSDTIVAKLKQMAGGNLQFKPSYTK